MRLLERPVAWRSGAELLVRILFDILNMGEHAWTTKELEQAAETYGIKKVDLKAFILQGAVKQLNDYTALGVDLGFFNEATAKLYANRNLEGLQPRLRLRCNLHRLGTLPVSQNR